MSNDHINGRSEQLVVRAPLDLVEQVDKLRKPIALSRAAVMRAALTLWVAQQRKTPRA